MTLSIHNKTEIITTQYIELNGFTYTIDHMNRVRSVGYNGSFNRRTATQEEIKSHTELAQSTVDYIRANIASIRTQLDNNLVESARSVTESRHTNITL